MKITKAKLKITKAKLATIIKEEYTSALATESEWRGAGTVHSDGLMDMIRDFVTNEVSGWHDVAKASLHKEIAENGFDISEIGMTALGGGVNEDLGPETGHPEGSQPLAILQAISDDLIETGKFMGTTSSTTTASEFGGFVESKGVEVKEVLDALDAEAGRNPGGSIGE